MDAYQSVIDVYQSGPTGSGAPPSRGVRRPVEPRDIRPGNGPARHDPNIAPAAGHRPPRRPRSGTPLARPQSRRRPPSHMRVATSRN